MLLHSNCNLMIKIQPNWCLFMIIITNLEGIQLNQNITNYYFGLEVISSPSRVLSGHAIPVGDTPLYGLYRYVWPQRVSQVFDRFS